MQTFKAGTPPMDLPQSMKDYLRDLETRIERAANAGSDSIPTNYLAKAPARPQAGLYNADGTNWNPGSGVGTYRYNPASATWTFIG